MNDILYYLKNENISFSVNEPLKKHSTFKIGKNASTAIFPDTIKKLIDIIKYLKEKNIKYLVLGKGSNILFPDYDIGYPLIFTEKIAEVYFDDKNKNHLICEAGATLAKTVNFSMQYNLGGMEFASGIPGTVGGAVVMNAGAYGKNIGDVLVWSEYIDINGEINQITNSEHSFGYRKSIFTADDVVLRSCFCMQEKSVDVIKEEISELALKRRTMQPLEFPSAGSVFKRPVGYYAGALIDDCGLRGFSVGGAQVSEKHCGFIVNTGNATSDDVKQLVNIIKDKVFSKFKIMLECEIRYID